MMAINYSVVLFHKSALRSLDWRFLMGPPAFVAVVFTLFAMGHLHASNHFRVQGGVSTTNRETKYFPSAVEPRRIVVFGDSWSDNGQYPVADLAADSFRPRLDGQGRSWTDWMCEEVRCLHHDNFARPTAFTAFKTLVGFRGVVTDSAVLNSTWMTQSRDNYSHVIEHADIVEPLADLTWQVGEWIGFERRQYSNSRSKIGERSQTVFCLWFSLWDIWYYSGGVFANAQVALTRSVNLLFEQLDRIAEHWPLKPQVLLLDAIDLTFLPAWRRWRTGMTGNDPIGEDQRNAILLVDQWNTMLEYRSRRWQNGDILVYHANAWLLDQIRNAQIPPANVTDANGWGAKVSPWRDVRSGCLGRKSHECDNIRDIGEPCPDPDSLLFWDDFHLGPAAMRIIGQEIAGAMTGSTGKPASRPG